MRKSTIAILCLLCSGVAAAAAGFLTTLVHPAFGASTEANAKSPQFLNGKYVHPAHAWQDTFRGLLRQFRFTPDGAPNSDLRLPDITPTPEASLRVTWFGHSTMMVEIEGLRLMIDPLIGKRASPLSFIGPKAFYDRGPTREHLSSIDAVLISHDHYDHLDREAIEALAPSNAKFIVPLGVGEHLLRWGIDRERITELDWWGLTKIGPITITATPARHGSGRVSPFSSKTLWAGFALVGARHRIWYSGDTGWQDEEFREIGRRLGPFELTMIDAGQYDSTWPDWHLSPELAVDAHILVKGNVLMPVHWGRYELAHHGWTEPAERAREAAACRTVKLILPAPGQPVIIPFPTQEQWWPEANWLNTAQSPIRPTRAGDPNERIDWLCQ